MEKDLLNTNICYLYKKVTSTSKVLVSYSD